MPFSPERHLLPPILSEFSVQVWSFLIKSTFIYSLKTSHMCVKHLDYTHPSSPPIPCSFCNPSSSKNFLSFSLKKKYSSLCPFRAAYISTGVGQNSGQGNDTVPLAELPASFLPTCSNGPELSFRRLHCLLTALGLRVKFFTAGLSPLTSPTSPFPWDFQWH